MSRPTRLVARLRRALAVAFAVGVPIACASVGDSDDAAGERDAGGDLRDAALVDGSPTADGASADAGACSASKICRTAVPIEESDRLLSVWGSSSTDVWAVGSNGLILHHDGTLWEKAERVSDADGSAASYTMRSVWLGGRDDVWLADGPRIRHSTGWNGPRGTPWSFYRHPRDPWDACQSTAVRGFGGTVWVALALCPAWLTRFEEGLDGGAPIELQASRQIDSYPTAIAVTRADEAWITKNDHDPLGVRKSNIVRVHLDGTTGTPPAPSWALEEYDTTTKHAPLGVWGNDAVIWAVGEKGLLLRLNRADLAGKKFEAVVAPVAETLYGIFGFGDDDIWAVGDASTVLHWDGKSWTKLATPFDRASRKPRLSAIWGSSPADVWIVGDGAVLHFQGNAP